MAEDARRRLPPVHELVDAPAVLEAAGVVAHELRVRAARGVLRQLRADLADGSLKGDPGEVAARRLARHLARLACPGPRPVVNATGVPLHTNLGRAPLGAEVVEAMRRAAAYTDLELDLASGKRGNRLATVSDQLALLCGTDGGLVVNNNAAAVLLVGSALARGGEIIVSRGELVEIGGSFRIPDVIASSGARLVEVGTTNRTRVADYRAAIGPDTKLLMKVHRSNFRVEGFTHEASREELAALAAEAGIPLVEDLGSGCFVDSTGFGLSAEPGPEAVLAAGVDLVTFSGDKLLGGAQAGLIAGRADLVQSLRRCHLLRALRLDKMMTAAVQATLAAYLREGGPGAAVPLIEMMRQDPAASKAACEALAERLVALGYACEVVEDPAPVGGGSMPGEALAGWVVEVQHPKVKPAALARGLRRNDPPVIVRVERERVMLDPRTLLGHDDALVAAFEGLA